MRILAWPRSKIIRNLGYTAGLNFIRLTVSVASNSVLFFILPIREFGIYAVAVSIVGWLNLVSDSGISLLKLKCAQGSHVDRFVTWASLSWLSLLVLMLGLLIPFRNSIGLEGGTQIDLTPAFLLVGLLVLNQLLQLLLAFHQRNLMFGRIAVAQLAGIAVSQFLVAIPLSILLKSWTALIIAQAISSTVQLTILFDRQSFPRPCFRARLARFTLRWCSANLFSSMTHWVQTSADRLIVAGAFSLRIAGAYERVQSLIGPVVVSFVQVVLRVVFAHSVVEYRNNKGFVFRRVSLLVDLMVFGGVIAFWLIIYGTNVLLSTDLAADAATINIFMTIFAYMTLYLSATAGTSCMGTLLWSSGAHAWDVKTSFLLLIPYCLMCFGVIFTGRLEFFILGFSAFHVLRYAAYRTVTALQILPRQKDITFKLAREFFAIRRNFLLASTGVFIGNAGVVMHLTERWFEPSRLSPGATLVMASANLTLLGFFSLFVWTNRTTSSQSGKDLEDLAHRTGETNEH